MASSKVPLPGSERNLLSGTRAPAALRPDERIQVTIFVRSRSPIEPLISAEEEGERQPLTREQFRAGYGADANDLKKIRAFARENGLEVVRSSAARRTVILSGTVAAFSAAFDVQLETIEQPGGSYRARSGPVYIPADLVGIIEGVFGLDDRPQAEPHFRVIEPLQTSRISYTPIQLARLYNFPTQGTGRGQSIAIIELGGGYRLADIRAYFAGLGIPAPRVTSVSVNGGRNSPIGDPNSADGEVLLDIEVAGAVAYGARIAVYFAPNTDAGFLNAVTTAVHDTTIRPSVVSISWGSAESSWTAQALRAMDQAFQAAAALGVTVCCASGDDGSSDRVTDGRAHVDFPSSSPYALACGGTRLEASGNSIASEVVWNNGPGRGATGGGISDTFGLPSWQAGASVPPSVNGGRIGRGVPDVAGNADPSTGYEILVDGQRTVFGGTSAVSPLWSGLIALLNEQRGQPVGYLGPLLYRVAREQVLRDITSGNNGAYSARTGWDACTGLAGVYCERAQQAGKQ